MTQGYRNTRTGYMTDMLMDTSPIGSIVPNFKSSTGSYDHNFVKSTASNFPVHAETIGTAYLNGDDPAYTHFGYLYCDGTEYNITDYPALYEIIGNDYGGTASAGIDVLSVGTNYLATDPIVVSAPPAGGVQIVAEIGAINNNGGITWIKVSNAGAGYTSAPTVTVTSSTGSGAAFQARVDPTGGNLEGVSRSNINRLMGEQNLGTFKVPDTITKKIVGNGPVYGSNSPNIGNSTMGTGTTGGKWFIDQSAQDQYFSLGSIKTSGYENVVETTECSIIGSQTVTITMRETKLPGVPGHNHYVQRAVPGSNSIISEYSGDRYLSAYRADTGKLQRFIPYTGEVLTHRHGLLRSPMADNKVATYDIFDYKGGDGGSGSTQNPYTSMTASAVSTANDTITMTSHGLTTATRIKYLSATTPIGGLTVGTEYYAVKVDVNTIKLATTAANASAVPAVVISLTSAGQANKFEWETEYQYQKYLASGSTSAGNTVLITAIPSPIFKVFTSVDDIGGREKVGGGIPQYDYSQVLVDSSTELASGSGSFGGITGTPDVLIWKMSGGGGSGAAGTTGGNNGGDSWLKIGPAGSEVVNITAQGGRGGNPATVSGTVPGVATAAATFTSSGSETIGGSAGSVGGAGTGGKVMVSDSASDPGGGGANGSGGLTISSVVYGGGTVGVRGRITIGGNITETFGISNPTGTFNISTISGVPNSVKFTLKGPRGADSSLDTYVGQNQLPGRGAYMEIWLNQTELNDFTTRAWSVKIGSHSSSRNGGTGPLTGQEGGYGGTGYNGAHGGGGGSSVLLYRDTQLIAGAGGGGGAGADGYDGGDGMSGGTNSGNAAGQTGGGLRKVQGSTALSYGAGGTGGHYGCRGGGGGGGGAGCAEVGFSGFGGGGAGGDPGSGGHDGGDGGTQGPSAYRSLYFYDENSGNPPQFTDHGDTQGTIKMDVDWDGSYWTAPGGGGGGGAHCVGNIDWSQLGNPSGFTYGIGGAGSGVAQAGNNTSGQTGNATTGYMQLAVGTITGYTGGNVTITTGDVIESASQSATVWDVDLFSGGAGTGVAGFKLPTTQVPTLVFRGGGLGDPPVSPQIHATGTVQVSNEKVGGVTLSTGGYKYSKIPYVYILNGVGTKNKVTAQIDSVGETVTGLTFDTALAEKPVRYLKFGGTQAATRFAVTVPLDTSNAEFFSIKAARGNGINGGDVPEENLIVEFQLAGTTTWTLIDTIINPNSARTDPLIGNVPKVTQGDATWDGGSGDTQWYTYSVALTSQMRGPSTKFRLRQVRAVSGGDNAGETDHYGICEITLYNQETSTYTFVPDPGAISKPLVDSLEYTLHGQSGNAYTYTSGLGCGDATLTLKSTTKIEPLATIDPDYAIPLTHPYQHCKYLIKAF